MTIEGVTLEQVAMLVAFIVALAKGIDYIVAMFKKPTTDLDEKIGKRLEKIEADNKMTLRVLFSLLQHDVTGDHVNDMSKLYDELQKYLLD